ncbi:hypothetical protein [Oceanidesulfovibrio marinus]|uniref:IclR-ED domain-containing protein n=1 Tax=Oceanidesulfovibrio marinus TaxID=370038 RepID=A0ABX6NKW8_9BACT|nr:hypothetical protein [Oceanidesulfovibrio marinus]QJT10856.1 hypothetical protein E8L03_18905 [Oceanidesulfovibrio marinus]
MAICMSNATIKRIAAFAEAHDAGGVWVSDGKTTQCVYAAPNPDASSRCGALALKYPLGGGLTLLVGISEARQLDMDTQSRMQSEIATISNHA